MIPALWNLVTAIFLALPFAPADVEAAGITVTVRETVTDRYPGAIGWTWCGGPACRIEVAADAPPYVLRHEVCHAVDWLSDGLADGLVAGWQPWAGDREAETGYYTSDAERLGYWCGRQGGRP